MGRSGTVLSAAKVQMKHHTLKSKWTTRNSRGGKMKVDSSENSSERIEIWTRSTTHSRNLSGGKWKRNWIDLRPRLSSLRILQLSVGRSTGSTGSRPRLRRGGRAETPTPTTRVMT